MRSLAVLVALCTLASPRLAVAHQTAVKYLDLVSGDDAVTVTLRLAPGDVTEPMSLPADATPPLADALAHPAVPVYVQGWVAIAGCTAAPASARAADGALAVSWRAACENPRALALDFSEFFALDPRHEMIVRYSAPHAEPIQTIVRASEPRITLRAGHSPSLLAWIHTGMDHIYSGLDHILFVIALLLVVMLYGGAGEWHLRAFVPTLRSTALVITAFTIAHSLTLIAAALGVVALAPQVVETVIALSIAYTAVENIANPGVRWRFGLTFAFGLVHGLGFASQLALLLPPTDVVVPLLCFNLGVELGQLTIVAVALPVLYAVARAVGAVRYRRIVLPIAATPLALIGLAMAVERVLEVKLLPM